MAVTLQTLRDQFYDILKEDEDSSAYPLAFADELLNTAQRLICTGGVVNLRTGSQIKKGPLPFLYSDKFYTTVQDTALTATTSTAATSLSVGDTTNFASSGKLWISGDIITYTGKTSTTFTGVTGVGFAHLSGTSVSQLFDLPTDYATSVTVTYDRAIPMQYKDQRNIYTDALNYAGAGYGEYRSANNTTSNSLSNVYPPFYTIINGLYFLPFQIDVSSRMIHMLYEKKATTMTTSVDATIPEEFATSTIPYIAVAEILFNRGEQARGIELNDLMGYNRVQAMYSYYANQHSELPFNQRVKTSRDTSTLNI